MTQSDLDKQLNGQTDQGAAAHEEHIETLGDLVPDVEEEPPPEELIPPELIVDDDDREDSDPA